MPTPNTFEKSRNRGSTPAPEWLIHEKARRKEADLARSAEQTVSVGRSRREGALRSSIRYVTPEMLPTHPDPTIARAAAAEITKRGKGWKLHLNFDPDDQQAVQRIRAYLEELKEQGRITSFKIGDGGGKADDQPGKEATVYVGAKDDAVGVASLIDEVLEPELLPPEGDALHDDIPFGHKVMGRFELVQYDPDFHQYGKRGAPFLYEEKARQNLARLAGETVSSDDAFARSDYILRKRYGTFYTGTQATQS